MSSATLPKIKPLIVDVEPPEGAVIVGRTPDGRPIYKRSRMMAGPASVKKDRDGNDVMKKHPTTGEPAYTIMTRGPAVMETMLIVPNQQGNGNLSWEEWHMPTEEELAAERRNRAIESAKNELAAEIVDSGLTVRQFVEEIARRRVESAATPSAPAAEAPVAAPAPENVPVVYGFPIHKHGNVWQLSDGSEFKGKKVDAQKADEALRTEAVAESNAQPEI
jgi:hypothetical protein